MAAITASTMTTLLHLSGFTEATMEEIIDTAIDILNLFGKGMVDLPNLGGTSGSKTVTLESSQAGAVKLVARAIYHGFYKGIDTQAIQSLTLSASDVLGNPTVMAAIREAAELLKDVDIDVG